VQATVSGSPLSPRYRILVEATSAGTPLRDRHIEQAERYAAEGNHRSVVLTNRKLRRRAMSEPRARRRE
jgi:hypothetical protein